MCLMSTKEVFKDREDMFSSSRQWYNKSNKACYFESRFKMKLIFTIVTGVITILVSPYKSILHPIIINMEILLLVVPR